MTEAEIRELLASFCDDMKAKAESRIGEAGNQLDYAMTYMANMFEETAIGLRSGQ